MAAPASFWDKTAEKYSKQAVGDQQAYQHKLDKTQKYLSPDSVVVELACGTGTTAVYHADKVKSYRAYDISNNMLEYGCQKAKENGIDNIEFICAPANEVKELPDSIDVVMAHSFLHLVESRDQVIEDIYKMLKPGGVFISSTMCLGDSWFFPIMIKIGCGLGIWPLVVSFKQTQLLESIKQAGFEIEYHWQPGKNKAVFIVARKPVSR